ncbi:nucleotidyltransferase domain-containing protein [Candidatus Woesearchaeota archaeon]|nr:nucleotidyltransferase domain-containing protein [Candidatus Woesearchaeota archaeon]
MRKETLLKIMELFRHNLKQGLTIRHVSQTLKIGYRPAYNHITTMAEQGIITIEKVGQAKQSFLNLKNENCRHLLEEVGMQQKKRLFGKYTKLRNILETILNKLTEKYISEIHSVVLFGSYAKDRQTEESDIDLLFIVGDIKDKALREGIERECASFQYSHNMRISPVITDIQELKRMLETEEITVGKETREYGIPLYGSEKFWRGVT